MGKPTDVHTSSGVKDKKFEILCVCTIVFLAVIGVVMSVYCSQQDDGCLTFTPNFGPDGPSGQNSLWGTAAVDPGTPPALRAV